MRRNSPGDYAEHFQRLSSADLDYFLEGGQAVNLWADFFLGEVSSLARHQPFTSKDCDLWMSKPALDQLPSVLEGKLTLAKTTEDVQVGVFQTRETPKKTFDLFGSILGISLTQLNRVRQRRLEIGGCQVMDPIFLFKAKCNNKGYSGGE